MRWALAVLLVLSGCQASPSREAAPSSVVTTAAARSPGSTAAPSKKVITDVADEHWKGPPLPRASVVLTDAFGAPHRVRVEVAHTPDSRQRGLMWRRELPAGEGMLFIFPDAQVQSFWMRNTLIPLDMLFIDDSMRVVGIVSRAEPLTRSPRTVGKVSRFVLEVPGGWTEAKGIRTGARVQVEGIGSVRVQ